MVYGVPYQNRNSFFHDSGLVLQNFIERVSQNLLVIEPDACDAGQIQILGVGCVVLASAGAVFLPRREPRTGRRPSAADGVRVTVDA